MLGSLKAVLDICNNMDRSKKIFLLFAAVFFIIMAYIGYDISSRTTFPGSKPQLKERIMEGNKDSKKTTPGEKDSSAVDTLQRLNSTYR